MKNLLEVIVLFLTVNTFAQDEINVIYTASPFLSVNTASQNTGNGEIGVVAGENNFTAGITKNPALLTGNNIDGLSVSQRSSFNETYFYNLSLKYTLSDKLSLGYTYSHFDLGTFYWLVADSIHSHKPKQFYHSLRMGYAVNNKISLGIGMKYFEDDIYPPDYYEDRYINPVKSYAIDMGFNYKNSIVLANNNEIRYALGADILNLGPKVAYGYSQDHEFIPTELNIGVLI